MASPVRPQTQPETGATRLAQLMGGLPAIAAATTRAEALQLAAKLALEVFSAEAAVVTLVGTSGERTESYSSTRGTAGPSSEALPLLGVPLTCHGIVRGGLYLTGLPQDRFTGDDEQLAVILTGCAATVLDRLDWQLERARLVRSHDRLLQTLGHDLGNALTAIYGWGELLVRRRDPASVPRAAFEMLDAAEGAIGLIHDVVDLTRMERHDLVPALASVSIMDMLANIVSRAEAAARTHEVELELAPCDPAMEVITDRRRLEQLLVHLLLNTVRDAGPGGKVRAACRHPGVASEFVLEIVRRGGSAPPSIAAEGVDDRADRGLQLWTQLGALLGATIKPLETGNRQAGFRISLNPITS